MKQFITLLLIGLVGLAFSGCSSSHPTYSINSPFNSEDGYIAFLNGKPYYKPYKAKYKRTPLKQIEAVYLASNGMNCTGGSLLWFANDLNVPYSINGMSDLAIKMHKIGKSGCSNKPLSNQEYQYYLNKQQITVQKKAEMNEVFNTMSQMGTQLQQMNGGVVNGYKNYNIKSSRSGCSSDFDCGLGQKCVKPQFSSKGSCMKSVNSSGIQQFNSHQNNVGPNMNKQCTFNTDCPIGFRCSAGNCIK